jgi:hypothetical protein
MDADLRAIAERVVREQRLDMPLDEAEELIGSTASPFEALTQTQRNAALLMLERLVLTPTGGHKARVRIGNHPASNTPPCMICRRPVGRDDWSFSLLSHWEITQIWLSWHQECLAGTEVEQEFDLMTGEPRSYLGLP